MELTRGCLRRVQAKEQVVDPVVQVTQVRAIKDGKRYKLVLSDGENSLDAMLSTQQTSMVKEGSLTDGTIIRLKNFVCNVLNGRDIVIVLVCEPLGNAAIIGNPQMLSASAPGGQPQQPLMPPQQQPQMQQQPQQFRPQQSGPARQYGGQQAPPQQMPQQQQPQQQQQQMSQQPQQRMPPQQQQQQQQQTMGGGNFGGRGPVAHATGSASRGGNYQPLASLNPYVNKWTVKARVVNKSDKRHWNKGENNQGSLFSVTIMDHEGTEVRATFFREGCETYFDRIEENRVYEFSNGRVKLANKEYSRTNSDIELTFDGTAVVNELPEDTSIVQVHLRRSLIAGIANVSPNSMVDVIGVATDVGEVQDFKSRNGRDLTKVEVGLSDESGASIRVTLWGDRARDFEAKVRQMDAPVVAFKNTRVSDWGGRTLGTVSGSQVLIEPEIPETQAVRSWYAGGGAQQQAVALSGAGGGGGTVGKSVAERHTLASIVDMGLGKEQPEFVEAKVTIMKIMSERMWYHAAPEEGNQKKVVEQSDGSWLCEATNQHFQKKRNRYIMRAVVADFTGSAYITFFNDQAVKVLGGISADELEPIKEDEDAKFQAIIKNAEFTTYLVKLKVKEEVYNEQARTKSTVAAMAPMDWVKENQELVKAIEKYS